MSTMIETALLLLMVVAGFSTADREGIDLLPRQTIEILYEGQRFQGENGTSEGESNYFKLLEQDGDSLLVGARNVVYNLSMTTMAMGHKIFWAPSKKDIETCIMKGKLGGHCQNYIRVLARQSQGQLLICGTHAFAPQCRTYMYDRNGLFKMVRQFSGAGISPYDPHDNSTTIYLRGSDEIISGTVVDFGGNDPLIYRKKLSAPDREDWIRTKGDDFHILDNPNFVASFEHEEFIYFWFRERAAEAMDNNDERQVYARVSRVCKNDKGGVSPAKEKFTSFLKARLNCSIGAATPFYFNELKAVSDPVESSVRGDQLVYAVFSTPETAVSISAVCVFSMKHIKNTFAKGTFKIQRTTMSLWTELPRSEIPSPRPGICVPDSTKLPEATVSFINNSPLINQPVNALRSPLYVQNYNKGGELTKIAVLPKVAAVDGTRFDVLFVGTSDGRVLKLIERGEGNDTVVVQSAAIFANQAPVVNLLTTGDRLVVVSADEVASVPVEQCAFATSCHLCVALQDPHCAWDVQISKCTSQSEAWRRGDVIQNIVHGRSMQCPGENLIGEKIDSGPGIPPIQAPQHASSPLSTQTLVFLCIGCIVVASVIGFFVGHRITLSRRLAETHHSASSTSGSDYDSFGRARLTRHDSLTNSNKLDHHVYGAPPSKQSVDAVSLVIPAAMSMSMHGGASGATTPGRDKNALMTSYSSNGTVPRDYKVKKVYL